MSSSVRRATWTVMGVAVAAKTLGFLREVVVARRFGTSEAVDLFLAAVTLPAILGTILSFAMPNAFVPLFTTEPRSARTRRLVLAILGGTAVLSVALAAFSPWVVGMTAAGFDTAARLRAEALLRVVAATVAFAAIEALGRSRLQARRSFVRPGIAYAWQNVAIIAAVLFAPSGGAATLAWGYAIGSGLAAVWNIVPLGHTGSPADVREAPVGRGVGRWVALVVLADSLGQIYAFVDRRYGSFLPEGSMAALQYGNLLAYLPLGIVATGLGAAILPFLSEAVARGEHDRAGQIFQRAIGASIEVLVPLTLWFVAFRDPIVSVVLERGAFDEASRRMTSPVLAAFAIGLVPGAFGTVATKVFHARRRIRPVLASAAAGAVVKWIVAARFSAEYGAAALALGTTAGLVFAAGILASTLPKWSRRGALRSWFRTATATAVPVLFGIAAGRLGIAALNAAVPGLLPTGRTILIAEAGAGLGIGIVALVAAARWFGLREITALVRFPRPAREP